MPLKRQYMSIVLPAAKHYGIEALAQWSRPGPSNENWQVYETFIADVDFCITALRLQASQRAKGNSVALDAATKKEASAPLGAGARDRGQARHRCCTEGKAVYADRRARADRATRGRFGVKVADLHRPAIDDLTRPNPDDPTGCVDDASRSRGARLLVRVGLDAVRPGALSVRERRLVRVALSRRLHRRVHRPVARLVLHVARARDCAVRPPGVPQLCQPRHRARRRRAEDVEEPAQLPGPDGGVRPARGGRDAVVPAVVADPPGQRLLGHRRRAARHGAGRAAAAVERVVLPHAVRERRRACREVSATASSVGSRRTCSTATSSPRPATSSRTSRGRWTPTTCSGRATRCGRSSRR